MILAKEKALEIVEAMYFSRRYKDSEDYIPKEGWIHAKECALITVNELIKETGKKYWYDVKSEMEKL
jgi:hypothetical protein